MSDVSIRSNRSVSSVTTPVSPIAPAVVQNREGSPADVTSKTPLGVRRVIDSTLLAKLPST
jgi:hypothetical protein